MDVQYDSKCISLLYDEGDTQLYALIVARRMLKAEAGTVGTVGLG
jgi:hypothetical protein